MSEYAGTWNVHTERGQEVPRYGLGSTDLLHTLRGLRDRGDTTATVHVRHPARTFHVALALPVVSLIGLLWDAE